MSDELTRLSAAALAALVARRRASPVEIAEAYLRRNEQLNPQLNAIVTFASDALERARRAEEMVMRGDSLGPLHGVPFTVKDTIETRGLRATSGSRLRAAHIPAGDASAVARLRKAGGILLGKTNVSEMAMDHTATDNPLFGRTVNPHNFDFSAGGSSGGEAAAVAAHLSPAGLGSDLTGSIRIPAHFCGLCGLKPTTPGVIPQDGQCPPSVDSFALGATVGPLARTVDDLALLYNVLAEEKLNNSAVRKVRVAFYTDDGITPVTEETRGAIERVAQVLLAAGLEVREERPPGVERGADLWHSLFSGQAAEFLVDAYRGREELAGPLVRAIIERRGERRITSAPDAPRERELLLRRLLDWMRDTPLIIAPVGATNAIPHGQRAVTIKDREIKIARAFSYAQTFNVFGLPAVCLPISRGQNNLPLGAQIVGPPGGEELILATARLLENKLIDLTCAPRFA